MDPNTYLEFITKAKALLTDRNTYYVLFMAVLGFLLWKNDNKVTELESEKKKSDSVYAVVAANLQTKIDNKNCVEEFKIWKDALMTDLDAKQENVTADLQLEKKRTQELQQTYQLIKQK